MYVSFGKARFSKWSNGSALRYVGKQIGTFDMESYLNNQTIEGSLLNLDCPVEGDSLALAATAATLSLILEVPVPSDVCFTGSVTESGVIEEVGGINAKLTAAKDFGLRKVFLPQGTKVESPAALEIIYVSRIDQLFGTLFATADLERGLAKLLEVRIPPELRRRTWVTDELVSGNPLRALLTCVGHRDPFGTIARVENPLVAHEDGPLLNKCCCEV